jgi:hypothetical protein
MIQEVPCNCKSGDVDDKDIQLLRSDDDNGNDLDVPRPPSLNASPQHQLPPPPPRRKLRILILSMGGERRTVLEDIFTNSVLLQSQFEAPVFCPGIPSRELRARHSLFQHCYNAGLIPQLEWDALQQQQQQQQQQVDIPLDWTTCLRDVPIGPPRRGNSTDVSLHYSVELWRKVKTINRGRAVLACALAHLIALRKLTQENYDVLMEDNVRFPIETVAQRIWDCIDATTTSSPLAPRHTTTDNTMSRNSVSCHMRYYGWLGSIPNLQWIYTTYIPKHICRSNTETAMVPCPIPSDITEAERIEEKEDRGSNDPNDAGTIGVEKLSVEMMQHLQIDSVGTTTKTAATRPTTCTTSNPSSNENDTSDTLPPPKISASRMKNKKNDITQPGGSNLVWGTYAYWISKEAYHLILQTLRNDVGALVWKSKRMRYYHVKPIDKIIPRIIRASSLAEPAPLSLDHTETPPTTAATATTTDTAGTVQIPLRPAFFRAPMLTSQLHTQYDEQFCISTTYQLQQTQLHWMDLCLTTTERRVVDAAQAQQWTRWLTPTQLLLSHPNNSSSSCTVESDHTTG